MSHIDNQKLMDYLSGKLPADQQHEVEKWMMDNPFNEEAMEGLQQAGDEKKVQANVDQLNKQLRLYLNKRKQRRDKRNLPSNFWTYITIICVLVLAIIAFIVIRKAIY